MRYPLFICFISLALSVVGASSSLAQTGDKPKNLSENTVELENSSEPETTGSQTKPQTKPLNVLLVTGGCCHDYPRQAEILAQGMKSRLGKVDWTVVDYGKEKTGDLEIYKNADWAKDYDLVIHNECYGGVKDAAVVRNIVEGHVKTGVPAVAIHCSMHSYREAENADLWRAFLGVTSRFHEKAKRSLTVIPRDPEHPVMQGFPKQWETPNGELYIILQTWPDMHVLATSYSIEQQADQPVVWTNKYKGVKMFATTLGHHNVTMESPEWLDMTARGIQWALTKD